jgi:hypothetical protein
VRAGGWTRPGAGHRAAVAAILLPLVAAAQRPISASTQSSALPPAWEVIDRHLEAAGGRAAFLKLVSREVWARYEIPARRLSGELRVLSSRPDRLLIKTEYPELGVAVMGFNGSVGWTADPGSRPTLVKGGALADLHADALFDRYDEENLVSAETMEIADFEGRRCIKVRIVRLPDRESFDYFDLDTGLFAGSVAHRATEKGPVTMLTVVSHYQITDGVRLPHLIRIRAGGVEQIVTVMRVTHNHVDPAVFDLPMKLRGAAP